MQNFLIPINRCTFYSHREIPNIFPECCQGEGPSMSISPRRSRVWSRLLKKVEKESLALLSLLELWQKYNVKCPQAGISCSPSDHLFQGKGKHRDTRTM